MRTLYVIPLSAFALSLASTATFAQQSAFEYYDANGDGKISKQEFQDRIRNNQSFQDVDANQDRRIDENEFGEAGIDGDYGLWDTDDNRYVDENEFYGGTFDLYDNDDDSYWDEDEWVDAVEDGWFGA
jgi:hypothetical protein